jgi:hypothetical protein
MDVDITITLTGPRNSYWYPMNYIWTNELQVKDLIGKDFFTFAPDYSNDYIQLFGEGIEVFTNFLQILFIVDGHNIQ